MKVYAGIVLYNPQKGDLDNILKIIKNGIFNKIIIYDNSEVSINLFLNNLNVEYIFNGKNDGLAIPYNKMLKKTIEEKADFLCLLDQDSNYDKNEIEKMLIFLSNNQEKIKSSAIVAPRSYFERAKHIERCEKLTPVKFAINSGSFLNISIIQKYCLFYDENIFLDGVDYEYGLQIRKKGLKTLIYENSVLEQKLGYNSKGSKFTKHSANRYYYIAHNRKFIYQKYNGRLGILLANLKNLFLLLKILIYEEEKNKKIKSCLKGIFL